MDAAATAARRLASSGVTSLSHGLTKQLSAAGGETSARNLVFSPLSIHSALSLVAAGSRGRTLTEFLSLLGATSRRELAQNVRGVADLAFPDIPEPGGPRVAFACGLWHDAKEALKPAYRDVAAASYRAVARPVNFSTEPEEARTQINNWVAATTNNLIDSILDKGSVTHMTRLVVSNAVYFKGSWKTPFHKTGTRSDKFHRLDGSTVDAEFMSSYRNQFVVTHDGFKVLKMPYVAQDLSDEEMSVRAPPQYSMYVVLPDERDGLWNLQKDIGFSPGFLRDHMPKQHVKIGSFLVPKFKLSFCASLNNVLLNLGIQDVFSARADLGDMLESSGASEPLFLSNVLHKAVIEVNEEGTEAAAATACVMRGCSLTKNRPVPVDFVADHPFAFFVMEEVSGAIVFAGHVLDPTQPDGAENM